MTRHRLAHSPRPGSLLIVAPLAALAFLLPGCTGSYPGGGDDDDDTSGGGNTFDDDDTAGDDDTSGDDDTFSEDTPSYPAEEAWFALAVGNEWEYREDIVGDVVSDVDDVLITVRRRIAGPEMDPVQSAQMVVFEMELNRAVGLDEVHWFGLDGSGSMKWVKTRLFGDFFESDDYPGGGSVVASLAASEAALLGAQYQALWFLGDVDGHDYSATSSTVETYFYGAGQEVETLGNQSFEDQVEIGIQYVKPGWGLVGQQLTFGSTEVTWTITDCSPCPPEAGL